MLYLKVAFDEALVEGDKSAFLLALKNVIDANGGMQALENKAKISHQHLYQMLNEENNTTLETLTSVLNAIGMTIDFKPLVNN